VQSIKKFLQYKQIREVMSANLSRENLSLLPAFNTVWIILINNSYVKPGIIT